MKNTKDDFIEELEVSIKKTLEKIEGLSEIEGRRIKIISGRGPFDTFSAGNHFETTYVEHLIFSLSENIVSNSRLNPIGWEVSYPDSKENTGWRKSRLDLALGFVNNSDYLFETAIEVKRWNIESTVPYNIWNDVFKLLGYCSDNQEVGKNKYILLFVDNFNNDPEINISLDEAFINLMNIKKQMGNDLNLNYSSCIDYIIREILEKFYKWDNMSINFIKNKIKKNINEGTFLMNCYDNVLSSDKKKLCAALLKINPKWLAK